MRIAIVSDTHLRHRRYEIAVPECDLLIHCGDALCEGTERELLMFVPWLEAVKAKNKIFIPGNHDWIFEKDLPKARSIVGQIATVLVDEMVEIGGLKIFGSPWQPEFCEWAFNLKRGWPLRKKWEAVPAGVDILVTHGPPLGILDWSKFGDEHVGCGDLRQEIHRIKPKLHCFGHIHGDYGVCEWGGILFVNASLCDEAYVANHPPILVEMEPGKDPVLLPVPGLAPPKKGAIPIRSTTKSLWS